MAHDDPSNPVEADDLQRDVDELQFDAARAEPRLDEDADESVDGARHVNGRLRDHADDETDLDNSVDELISDAVSAVESLEDDLEAGVDPAPEDAAAVDDIAAEVDDLVDEAARAIQNGAPRETVAVVEFEDDFDDDDSPDATTTPEREAPTPKPVADDSPQTIQALDAKIEAEAAAFEDELDELEGDFHSADEIEALDDALPPSVKSERDEATIELDERVAEISLDDDEEERAVEAAPPARPAKLDSPFAGESAPTAPARPASPKKPAPHAKPKAPATPVKTKPSPASRLKSLAPVMRRFVLMPLARPLGKLDPVVRDSIGWVGLNTLFLALCLWIYLILR